MSDVMSDETGDLAQARQGGSTGEAAFARLYDRHGPVVLSLCRLALREGAGGGRGGAEDALQEVFIRAHRQLEKVESEEKLRPWLYGIARRVCSERRRAAGRRAKHEGRAMTLRVEAPAIGSAERADRAEQLERLSEALGELPENERLAIHLYYLDADPVAAAGEAIGISRSGFYKLLARARGRLSTLMSGVTTP